MDAFFSSLPLIVQLSFFLDAIPVALAVYALFKLHTLNDASALSTLSKLTCLLLIVCQLTWIHSYLNQFPLINSLVDNLWTIFNSIVMLVIINVTTLLGKQGSNRGSNHDRVN